MYNDLLDTIGFVGKYDKEVADAMNDELHRQQRNIELIASENFVSPAVMAAMGSVLTNKYAEGFPGKRYYGGCEYVDVVENIAIERAKKLFGAEHACVQPHSGAQANQAVYTAFLKPGDTVMGMNLAHGGHLTHGSPVNISGMYYNFVPYGVNDDGFIDYDEMEKIAFECKPKLIVAGASAYARIIDFERISQIAKKVDALLMVDMAHIAGLVAAGMILANKEAAEKYNFNKAIFPGIQGGPLMHIIAAKAVCFGEALTDEFKEYQKQIIKNAKALADGLIKRGHKLVSGGTDNHLMLLDLIGTGVTGKELQNRLDECYITANKNAIPNDPESPFVTSGVRLGTPAATTRGLKEEDFDVIAECIHRCIVDFDNKEEIKKMVTAICEKYPLYK